MLRKVIGGGFIDAATLDACAANANFETDVGPLNRKKTEFDGLMMTDKFTCSEKTISFSGKIWSVAGDEIPALSDHEAASTDYLQNEYAPEFSSEYGTGAFDFCDPSVNRGKDRR